METHEVPERPARIGVIGAGRADPTERARAFAVGAAIATAGCAVVCGGLGGVMEAAAAGASSRGGLVVGVLPGADPGAANPYVTLPVATGIGEARNAVIVQTSDVLIAIGGGHGTLSEIAFALRASKPVFGLDTWDVAPGVVACRDADEAVAAALRAIRAPGPPP